MPSFIPYAALLALSLSILHPSEVAATQQSAQQLYIDGEGALQAGDLDKAERLINEARKQLGSSNARLASTSMQIAFRRGLYIEAEKEARTFREFNPAPALFAKFTDLVEAIELQGAAARQADKDWRFVKSFVYPTSSAEEALVANHDGSFSTFGYGPVKNQNVTQFLRNSAQGELITRAVVPCITRPNALSPDSSFACFEGKYKSDRKLVKLSASNKPIFSVKIKDTAYMGESDLLGMGDGGYVFAWMQRNKKTNPMVVKAQRVNVEGKTLWTKDYTLPANYFPLDTLYLGHAIDGGVILAGKTRKSGDNLWALQLTSAGTIANQWGGSVPPIYREDAYIPTSGDVLITVDHFYKEGLPGYSGRSYRPRVVAFNSDGKTRELKQFNFPHEQLSPHAVSLIRHPKGGYLLLLKVDHWEPGKKSYQQRRAELLHLDDDWNLVSRATIGRGGFSPTSMAMNASGTLAIVGKVEQDGGGKSVQFLLALR